MFLCKKIITHLYNINIFGKIKCDVRLMSDHDVAEKRMNTDVKVLSLNTLATDHIIQCIAQ